MNERVAQDDPGPKDPGLHTKGGPFGRYPRNLIALQILIGLVFMLVSSATHWDEVFLQKASRVPDPEALADLGRLPVIPPYDNLFVYAQAYSNLGKRFESQVLVYARDVANLQAAMGKPVTLPATVQEIFKPNFSNGIDVRLRDAKTELMESAFSARVIPDESLQPGTLDHHPVEAGGDYFVSVGHGLWSKGKSYPKVQSNSTAEADGTVEPGYYISVRLTYGGRIPVTRVVLPVHVDSHFSSDSYPECWPIVYTGHASFSGDLDFMPGESLQGFCPLVDEGKVNTSLSLSAASSIFKQLQGGIPKINVAIAKSVFNQEPERPTPEMQELLERTQEIPPEKFKCGNDVPCRWNQWLSDRNILPYLAGIFFRFAVVACFAASLVTGFANFSPYRILLQIVVPAGVVAITIFSVYFYFLVELREMGLFIASIYAMAPVWNMLNTMATPGIGVGYFMGVVLANIVLVASMGSSAKVNNGTIDPPSPPSI